MNSPSRQFMFLAGIAAVLLTAAWSLYDLWEARTLTGQCIAAERELEHLRTAPRMTRIPDDPAGPAEASPEQERLRQLCLAGNRICLAGFTAEVQAFCDIAGGTGHIDISVGLP